MQLQRVFKDSYINRLYRYINVDNYLLDEFPYEKDHTKVLANIYKPDNLLDKMMSAADECDAAIALYEAYKNLTPLVASMPNLWCYLTHVDLFKYVQKRWPDIETGYNGEKRTQDEKENYIRDHWFQSVNGYMRTSLMGLWWSVYLSVDEDKDEEHKYDLTRVLFSNIGMRVRRLGASQIGRHKEAMLGILQYIKDNEWMQYGLENKMIWIGKYFTYLNVIKKVAYMDRKFFYQEMEKHKDALMNIKDRYDIVGVDIRDKN